MTKGRLGFSNVWRLESLIETPNEMLRRLLQESRRTGKRGDGTGHQVSSAVASCAPGGAK